MSDFFNIFTITFSIICILRCFYDTILARNKFKNCRVKIVVEYDEKNIGELEILGHTIKHIKEKYLIDADILYQNIDT